MNLPKISIVTPSYNQGRFLEQTIKSVLNQNYPNLNYIIIDGGSTDNSVEIIKRYQEHLDYWVSEPDRGFANGINKGLRLCTGEIIGWLNSDDTHSCDTLLAVARNFQTRTKCNVLTGRWNYVDAYGRILWTPRLSSGSPKLLNYVNRIGQPSTFWRKEVQEEIGLLDESLREAADYDYWIRIAKVYSFFVTNEVLSNYRLHSTSITVSQYGRMWQDTLKVMRKYRNDVPAVEDFRYVSLAHRYYRYRALIDKWLDMLCSGYLHRHVAAKWLHK